MPRMSVAKPKNLSLPGRQSGDLRASAKTGHVILRGAVAT